MKKILLNVVLVMVMMCGVMVLNHTVQASEWDKGNVQTVDDGSFVFKAYISNDGTKSWIYNVKVRREKYASTLRFPSAIGNAKVTKIGHKENKEDGDICHNIFGGFVEWYHDFDGYEASLVNIKEVVIPNSVESITKYCFAGLRSLTTVNLPKKLKKLDAMVFINSRGIKEITVPKKLKDISVRAFDGCKGIENIKVNKKNKAYKSADGMLLSKNGRTLYLVPATKKTVSIPGTVKKIAESAFCQSQAKKIYIPKSVTDIGDNALSCKAEYVELSRKNPVFAMDGECIYNKKSKALAAVVNADKNIAVSSNVKIIPGGVSVIGECAKYLEIPASVTKLETPYWHKIAESMDAVIKFRSAKPPVIITDIPSWEYAYFPTDSQVVVPKAGEKAYRNWFKETESEEMLKNLKTY